MLSISNLLPWSAAMSRTLDPTAALSPVQTAAANAVETVKSAVSSAVAPSPTLPARTTDTFQGVVANTGSTLSSLAGAVGEAVEPPADFEKLWGLGGKSADPIDSARASGDPARMAEQLHALATDRSSLLLHNPGELVAKTARLLQAATPAQVSAIRASYIQKYGCDPEMNIRSADFGQPLARLDHGTELQMLSALNGPQMRQTAATISSLLDKANAGTLTQDDRKQFFSMMPRIGLWNTPVRAPAGDHSVDSMERKLLSSAWASEGKGVDLDGALHRIEGAMPAPQLASTAPRQKSIAVIVSSHGAQWQELMDYAQQMDAKGYHLQIFTPEGQPVSFQRDSLSVDSRTAPLGFGCPPRLDPNGPTGELAQRLLTNTAPASRFDPKQFGAVYLAGGLGFNEDVAVAKSQIGADGRPHTTVTADPNIARMMDGTVAEKLPIIGLCHGPTLLAASNVGIQENGLRVPLNQGVATASLPPAEGFVQLTGRKEPQFSLDVDTHAVLAATGGITNTAADFADMSRVVKSQKDGIPIITGAAPQAAIHLADPTVDAMNRRWATSGRSA